MSLEGDIRTALLDMSAVTTLVGTGDSARIRPYVLDDSDDKTEEHIVVEVDREEKANDLSGVGGLEFATVTLSCRAITAAQADALVAEVERHLTRCSKAKPNRSCRLTTGVLACGSSWHRNTW
jgi:hypothetical protein